MFSKIKSIWASVKATFKGFTMSGAPNETLLQKLETDISAEVHKVENFIDPVAVKVEAQALPAVTSVEAMIQAATPALAAAAKAGGTGVGGFLLKLRDALAIFDAVPAEFDTFAAPIIKAGGSDIEDALTKIEKILDYKGVKSALWGEIVAVVKVL